MSFSKVLVIVGVILLAGLAYWQVADEPPPLENYSDAQLASMAFRQQILHASDLVAGVAEAIERNDDEAITRWQQKAIEVAVAAELADSDLEFIRSEKGRDYLIFHAKRALFNKGFEQHYYQLKGIDALKSEFPEARDLFAEADKLIAARDAIILDIASELKDDDTTEEEALSQAKTLWQERFRQTD
ncbi:hypothetical protein [Alteromonas lipolytica]|uniref:Uncharacterized protein n=1 Tax=Alteromonas lipolytica TaxID=1856405 RepID=A0A1E8FKX5_9ALTE|nr:hypothetical protein [Alteromonas lipolytica]OFI36416.1 hypothetical protein BFC17_00610 [Alteromonas lipolytica]GGF70091.1 hypothetical protein GCM10011338_22790 [Alteromonas lipolytica]